MVVPNFQLLNREHVLLLEGKEPDAFWDALGGKTEYANNPRLHVRSTVLHASPEPHAGCSWTECLLCECELFSAVPTSNALHCTVAVFGCRSAFTMPHVISAHNIRALCTPCQVRI